jgi:D-aminopeptidase
VGQSTLIVGDSIRTGVTAILPHPGNLFLDRVPAAIYVGNGFGKLLGSTQVAELGELETPILLTCTLCVWKAADALVAYLLAQPGMEDVRSINPVVGETNDGYVLNAIRQRPISPDNVVAAIKGASGGPVAEGSVGAGTGTVAFGWKGGIGTSSRLTGPVDSRWTVGVLVQTNFGGDLHIMGVPVGRAAPQWSDRGTEQPRPERLDHDRRRHRCAALGPESPPRRGARDYRGRPDWLGGRQRLGRLRHRVFHPSGCPTP